MHLVVHELAVVAATIGPGILPMTLHFIVREFTFVAGLVEHHELAHAVAVAVSVLTLEVAIMPLFISETVLLIALPLTLVDCFVSAHQFAGTLAYVVSPLAMVVAAIGVKHTTLSTELVVDPVAVVSHAAGPDLRSSTVTLLSVPLTRIERVIFDSLLLTDGALETNLGNHLLAALVIEVKFAKLSQDLPDGVRAIAWWSLAPDQLAPLNHDEHRGVRLWWYHDCIVIRVVH